MAKSFQHLIVKLPPERRGRIVRCTREFLESTMQPELQQRSDHAEPQDPARSACERAE